MPRVLLQGTLSESHAQPPGRGFGVEVRHVDIYPDQTKDQMRARGQLFVDNKRARDFDVKVTKGSFSLDNGGGSGFKYRFNTEDMTPMSYQRIKLGRAIDGYHGQLVPNEGESLAQELLRAVEQNESWAMMGRNAADEAHFRRMTATLMYLAADAYDLGADASFGHNRTARYQEQARDLRAKATQHWEIAADLRNKFDAEEAERRRTSA